MIIETERLILRRPMIEDFEAFWLMINDPIAKKYTGRTTTKTYDERLKEFIEYYGTDEASNEFAIIEKESNRYIGYCGFRYCDVMLDQDLYCGLCRQAWGKGYGFEAVSAVANYAFFDLKFDHIVATAHPENVASQNLLDRIGAQYVGDIVWPDDEGTFRKYQLNQDNFNAKNNQ